VTIPLEEREKRNSPIQNSREQQTIFSRQDQAQEEQSIPRKDSSISPKRRYSRGNLNEASERELPSSQDSLGKKRSSSPAVHRLENIGQSSLNEDKSPQKVVALESKVEILNLDEPANKISEDLPQASFLIRRNSSNRKATPPRQARMETLTRQPVVLLRNQNSDSTADEDYQKTIPNNLIRVRQQSIERNEVGDERYRKVVQVNVEGLSPVRSRDLSSGRRRSLVRVGSGVLNISQEKTNSNTENEKADKKEVFSPVENYHDHKKTNTGNTFFEKTNDFKRTQVENFTSNGHGPSKNQYNHVINKVFANQKASNTTSKANNADDDWDRELFGEDDEVISKEKQNQNKYISRKNSYSPTYDTNDLMTSQVKEVTFVRNENVHNDWDDDL